MRRKKFFIPGSIVVLAVAYVSLMREDPLTFTKDERVVNAMTPKQEQREPARVNVQKPKKSIIHNEILKLQKAYPDKNDVKEEVKKNPHSTPESLVDFAKVMGPLMEKALKSRQDADVLISELHNCASDERVAESARALCVSNVDKISKTHSEFKDKANEIHSQLSPEVRAILDKKKMFIRN